MNVWWDDERLAFVLVAVAFALCSLVGCGREPLADLEKNVPSAEEVRIFTDAATYDAIPFERPPTDPTCQGLDLGNPCRSDRPVAAILCPDVVCGLRCVQVEGISKICLDHRDKGAVWQVPSCAWCRP